MVKTCCVKKCNTQWSPHADVSFFSFPLKNDELLKEWIRVVPTGAKVSKYSHICNKHFTESSYTLLGDKRILNKGAVPTIFDNSELTDITAQKENICRIYENADSIHDNQQWDNDGEAAESNFTFGTRDATTQTYPHRLPPTEREIKLRRKIKILQDKLRRREGTISIVRQLLNYLNADGKQSDQLEETLLRRLSEFK